MQAERLGRRRRIGNRFSLPPDLSHQRAPAAAFPCRVERREHARRIVVTCDAALRIRRQERVAIPEPSRRAIVDALLAAAPERRDRRAVPAKMHERRVDVCDAVARRGAEREPPVVVHRRRKRPCDLEETAPDQRCVARYGVPERECHRMAAAHHRHAIGNALVHQFAVRIDEERIAVCKIARADRAGESRELVGLPDIVLVARRDQLAACQGSSRARTPGRRRRCADSRRL